MMASSTLSITKVTTMANTQVTTTAIICAVNTGPPSSQPNGFPSTKAPVARVAKTPVSRAPKVPPTPCTPKTSSESSYPKRDFSLVQARKHNMPTATPIISAGIGVTNPEAGVMQTKPATTPEHVPKMVGLPRKTHSIPAHVRPAAAAAKWVAQNALAASPLAASALPALNPNQPTHNIVAPTAV